MNVCDLPTDLLLEIFDKLSFQDVIQCSLICKRFKHVVLSNFSRYHLGSYSVDEFGTSRKVGGQTIQSTIFSDSNPIVAIYENRVDVFEYHPFSSRFYRTATATQIPLADIHPKVAAVISTTSLLVFCTRSGKPDLVIYDLRNDRELARQPLERCPRNIVCSTNCVVLGDYPLIADFSLYSWNGADMTFWLHLHQVSCVICSHQTVIYQYYCHLWWVEILDESLRVSAPTCSSGCDGEVFNRSKTVQVSNLITCPAKPEWKALDTEIYDDLVAVSSDGQLVVVQCDDNRERLSEFLIYNTETAQFVLKFDRVYNEHVFSGCFSEDSRFLLLKYHHKVVVVDLSLKRKLNIALPVANRFSCSSRYFCGEYLAQIINLDRADLYKIDESSVGWEPIE